MMLAIAVLAAIPLLVLARQWEREGEPERFVGLIVAVLLIESLVYPAQSEVPVGPFRIPIAGGDLRTHDYLVVVGLLARATVRPSPGRIGLTGTLWLLSFIWLATAAVRGLLVGHQSNIVLFSLSSLIGLFGARVLVAGCDPKRLIALLRKRFVIPLGVIVLLMLPDRGSDASTFLGTGLGAISVDAASVFVALGTFVVLVEWSSPDRHRWALWASIPLLASPFAIEQRATLLHLGATVLIIGWAMTTPSWRSNIRVPRVQLLWALLVGIGVLMLALMVQLSNEDGSVPFSDYYEATFASETQQLSAQARRESFVVGMDEWSTAPMYGHGLGHTYEIVRPFGVGVVHPATFDNVPLDLLVRAGLVGLTLFAGAFFSTLRDGISVWKRQSSSTVAALALAAVAVMVGLGVKSVFESILEKGKLALVLGLSAGVIAAALRSARAPSRQRDSARPREPEWI